MTFPAFLLRCLLALALVAGGVPTYGMATGMDVVEAKASSGCHDALAQHLESAAQASENADCCGSADCQCDCLQHMPVVVLALPPIAAPAFVAPVPLSRLLQLYSHQPSTSLRPPIG
jgi:hypothetical protein